MSIKDDLPIPEGAIYNQTFYGFFGEFGSGANAKIFYLQSALKPSDLEKITLISDIPGAETWSVRDLFQRDVDNDRVTKGLIPYFKDPGKVKFFNPLTLTILPIDERTREILTDMQDVHVDTEEIDGREWLVFEAEGLYRYMFPKDLPQYGRIEWNDKRVRIVAIDGQHRLSALKRYANDPERDSSRSDFLSWSIPVVLFSLRVMDASERRSTVLDVIRNIFVYINTQAKTPNASRQILLSDESVNDVCAQELLEYSHENDVKDYEHRVQDRLPLLVYDWRGEERGGRQIKVPGSLKSIVEVRDWFEIYILGEDFSAEQKAALGIQPVDPLHEAFAIKHLSIHNSQELRRLFRENVLPGISHLLEAYTPIKEYVKKLRGIEQEYNQRSDIARYAFHLLRFGTHTGGSSIEKEIKAVYNDILEDITDAITGLPDLLRKDIGMRGVIYSFGEMRKYYANMIDGSATWVEYSKWFTDALNQSYGVGWLSHKKEKRRNELLLHVTHDHNETTINYRLDHAADALGAFMCLLVGAFAIRDKDKDVFAQLMEEKIERLYGTLLRGYKKEVRLLLKEDYPNGGKELNDAVKEVATDKVEKHVQKLTNYLNKVNAP